MDPEQIRSILDEADELLAADRPAEALRCLARIEDVVLEADDRIECATLGAMARTEMGRVYEALDMLEPLLDEFPDSPRLYGVLGVALSEADELEGAREALETAVNLDESDDVTLANLAFVYEKLHDYDLAIETYQRALELGADIDWTLPRLAAAQSDKGDYRGAKATLKRYLSIAPDDAMQWISLAILCSDDKTFDEAYACYAQAERIEPDSPWLRLNWGVSAVHAGALPLAREQLERFERVCPKSSRATLLRAFILEEEGRLDEAESCYDQALKLARPEDHAETVYALEMAMDFFARRDMPERYEPLLERAYGENACTVELCEAYREATGRRLAHATWFSLLVEADYRGGLLEVTVRGAETAPATAAEPAYTRFLRNCQVVARDRDDAVAMVLELSRRMGETGATVREFVREETMANACTGVYEVEAESLVFRPAATE